MGLHTGSKGRTDFGRGLANRDWNLRGPGLRVQKGNPAALFPALNFGWRIPKIGIAGDGVSWTCIDPTPVAITMGGTVGVVYDVLVRFVGVIEFCNTPGATRPDPTGAPHFGYGGGYDGLGWNYYYLDVSSSGGSPKRYDLNIALSGYGTNSEVVDYTATLRVDGGATVTAHALTVDGVEDSSGYILPPPAVTDPAQPYLGQFLNIIPLSSTIVP